jgi:phosphoribosyl-ATP pyrophosphohydrolase/phosphoribosyl-AMP cyclohydrolase
VVPEVKYDEKGLVPAVTQDDLSGRVLMLAYMNEESLGLTKETGYAHYFSRSRNEIWKKGETSGDVQRVVALNFDCDLDAVLLRVEQQGVTCHTGRPTCFFHKADGQIDKSESLGTWDLDLIVRRVFEVIESRKDALKIGLEDKESYVQSLLQKGQNKILKKIGEESSEVVAAASRGNENDMVEEVTDLWFHTLVLLSFMDRTPENVFQELKKRFGTSGIEEKKARESQ